MTAPESESRELLTGESVVAVLHALATGYLDRAINVVATAELDEAARRVLWAAIADDGDASERARRFGDALRSLGVGRPLVNECYRVSFYSGDGWKALSANPLFAYFVANRGGDPLDKWVHYFPIYERHLARYRGHPVRALEIGVYRGGGLELLQHHLGPDAQVFGIDIDETARMAVGDRYLVELGDQEDPAFLTRVVEAHGPFDIIIDDGGHTMRQQIVSVETLFPTLNDGGTYLVEDSHTSYWPEYMGAEGEPTFIAWAKARVDDLHAYHHSLDQTLLVPWQTDLDGLHIYDGIVALEKVHRSAPFNELTGGSEFLALSRESSAIHIEILATRAAAIVQKEEAEAKLAEATAKAIDAPDPAPPEVVGSREEIRLLRGELVTTKQDTADLRAELEAARAELEDANTKLAGSWGIIQEMRRSASWKVTAPLRRAKALVRGR